MKYKLAMNVTCTLVFMLGVLVGTLMHGHFMWHDIVAAIIAGLVFGSVIFTQFRVVLQKVSKSFIKKTQ